MVAPGPVSRGEVYLVDLRPTRGAEIRKARPCVVVSPDDLNAHLRTYIVASLKFGRHAYPFRVACRFKGRRGHVVLDQIRPGDRERRVRRMGRISGKALLHSLSVLQQMFAP